MCVPVRQLTEYWRCALHRIACALVPCGLVMTTNNMNERKNRCVLNRNGTIARRAGISLFSTMHNAHARICVSWIEELAEFHSMRACSADCGLFLYRFNANTQAPHASRRQTIHIAPRNRTPMPSRSQDGPLFVCACVRISPRACFGIHSSIGALRVHYSLRECWHNVEMLSSSNTDCNVSYVCYLFASPTGARDDRPFKLVMPTGSGG